MPCDKLDRAGNQVFRPLQPILHDAGESGLLVMGHEAGGLDYLQFRAGVQGQETRRVAPGVICASAPKTSSAGWPTRGQASCTSWPSAPPTNEAGA